MAQSCPHCFVENPVDAAFCGSCGKALPAVASAGPRVVGDTAYAATGAGQRLQTEELDRQRRKAFGILLAVAILQAVGGTILLALANANVKTAANVEISTYVYALVYGLAAIFLVLSFWARSSPLPASIVGLALFCTIHLLDAIADPATLLQGILVKIIVVVALVKAIQAGVRHREILRQQTGT